MLGMLLGAVPSVAVLTAGSSAAAVRPAAAQPAAVRPAAAPVRWTITTTAPAGVRAGEVLTVKGTVTPAILGRPVYLWLQRGNGWQPVAEAPQTRTGTFVLVRADTVGRHLYRVVAPPTQAALPVTKGPVRVVTTLPARAGVRSTYLSDTDPPGTVVGEYGSAYLPDRGDSRMGPFTVGGTIALAGRPYPKSIRTTSRRVSVGVGVDAVTFSTALGLVTVKRRSCSRVRGSWK